MAFSGKLTLEFQDCYTSMKKNGQYPSITMNNKGWIVQVFHKETVIGLKLRYKIGFLHEKQIIWSDYRGSFNTGYYPRISINDDGLIVTVFSHQVHKRLFYRLGLLTFHQATQIANTTHSARINWLQDAMPLSEGLNPSVSINKKNDVIVTFDKGFNTYYRIGCIDKDEIKWFQSEDGKQLIKSSASKHSSVAINGKRQVVVGYSSWAERATHYTAGYINEDHTLILGENNTYTPAGVNYQPVVSLNTHGHVVVVHHSLQGRLYLKINHGVIKEDQLAGQKIEWALENPRNFGYDGYYASVAVSDTMKVVTAYKSLTLKIKTSVRNYVGELSY